MPYAVHVGFLRAQEGFDTTTALGRLLLNLLASLAEFELELIRERVTVGMERVKREGKAMGRPRMTDNPRPPTGTSHRGRAVRPAELSPSGPDLCCVTDHDDRGSVCIKKGVSVRTQKPAASRHREGETPLYPKRGR
ncbi:recombinase family protein [Sulfobacillus sp. hq2]|uniref:recombinase family protein n=1 Tax=Sulfobacillus sp. hq2 TaxID=2039167 RepID=UPI002711DC5E|nr:recombinase family protein [Sulfobacillus sp. hq2]